VRYDQNPLVAVTEVFNWGFRGINYHWGEVRQYTWDEVAGAVYEVYREEIDDLRRLPFSNILTK
jgi:F420-0:gamma-glutamyl ligase-like protein